MLFSTGSSRERVAAMLLLRYVSRSVFIPVAVVVSVKEQQFLYKMNQLFAYVRLDTLHTVRSADSALVLLECQHQVFDQQLLAASPAKKHSPTATSSTSCLNVITDGC